MPLDHPAGRLELGRTEFRRRDVIDLLTPYGLYCVHDEAERANLLALAAQTNAPG